MFKNMNKRMPLILVLLLSLYACDKDIPVKEVVLSQESALLMVGEQLQLGLSISPNNATYYTPLWASTTPSVAIVSDKGLVTAISEGASTITSTIGGKVANCYITVQNRSIPVSAISLNEKKVSIKKGETLQLQASITPVNATDNTILWQSDDESIVTVDGSGIVTGVDGGITVVSAKAGDAIAYCVIQVIVPVASISLNKSSLLLHREDSFQLSASISPANATNTDVKWSTDNESVAEVSEDGIVWAKNNGEAHITASVDNQSAICTVSVVIPTIECVDLGLSVKWGTQNLEAKTMEDRGEYFSWGELSPKNYYDWATYALSMGTSRTLTKYTNSTWGYNYYSDNLTQLELIDDAAYSILGEGYRIPTDAEWVELLQNCSWKDYSINGIFGYKVTSKKTGYTDKWIFLPYGYQVSGLRNDEPILIGDYWSSNCDARLPLQAISIEILPAGVTREYVYRCNGLLIRPIFEKP